MFWNQIPEQGCSGEFGQKFLEAQLADASQIVSHILRMWRLMNLGKTPLNRFQCALLTDWLEGNKIDCLLQNFHFNNKKKLGT